MATTPSTAARSTPLNSENSPEYSQAYYAMGEIYGKQGNSGKSHYYLGVYYQKKFDLKNALFHLNRALKFITDETERDKTKKLIQEIKKGRRPEPSPEQSGEG